MKVVAQFSSSYSLLIQNVTISAYLLCVGEHLLIISDQEDESIWKILAMENALLGIGFTTYSNISQ